MQVEILDGGMGSELELRGLDIPRAPWWSAAALRDFPHEVEAVHRDYVAAGAKYHIANTFRTQKPSLGPEWERWARVGIRLLRSVVSAPLQVCASIAPLGHCYTPNAAPVGWFPHFRELASVFREEGADILLCETFCSEREVCAATDAAVTTGLPTWVALTPGPDGSVLTPRSLRRIAAAVASLGPERILVNCVAASRMLPYIEAIADLPVPIGAYANAGGLEEGVGWAAGDAGAERYAELAVSWAEAGASVIGGCCGTRPIHIDHLRAAFLA